MKESVTCYKYRLQRDSVGLLVWLGSIMRKVYCSYSEQNLKHAIVYLLPIQCTPTSSECEQSDVRLL